MSGDIENRSRCLPERARHAVDALALPRRLNIISALRSATRQPAGRLLSDDRHQHLEAITAHQKQLKVWANNCPENFENRVALVDAEIADLEGRELDAARLYEQAIRSARDNAFVQNEALAYELAARSYAARGFEQIAHLYLRNAHHGYLRWGADGKVRQLEQHHPRLRENERVPGPTTTIGTPVQHLDLATVIKVSQVVSGEIVLEKLIETLVRTAIEQAGAERGLFASSARGSIAGHSRSHDQRRYGDRGSA